MDVVNRSITLSVPPQYFGYVTDLDRSSDTIQDATGDATTTTYPSRRQRKRCCRLRGQSRASYSERLGSLFQEVRDYLRSNLNHNGHEGQAFVANLANNLPTSFAWEEYGRCEKSAPFVSWDICPQRWRGRI